MHALRHKGFSLAALGLFTGFAVTSVTGCPEGGVCGPCGSIATGQLSISGDAKLDGFFKAVADFQGATARISGDFDANIIAIAEAWGMVEAGADITVDGAFVGDLIGMIKAELSASVEGSIRIEYQPPKCQADINVSVSAQASCEASAGCDCEVDVDAGELSVKCEGQCSGGCSAECSGSIECKTPEIGISCEGSCEGSCELEVGATCEGTCSGGCTGECSLTNAAGECEGTCTGGECTGTCEMSAGASCSGTCHGTCVAEADPGGCEGEIGCRGSCSGECSGSCEGAFEPPSASVDCECEASADCNAQASAQAEANISCSPPSLELVFELSGNLQGEAGASARAAFAAKIDVLKVRGVAILQGSANLLALVDGKINGEVVFEPSPLVNLTGQMQGIISGGLSGDFDIPVGRIDCVIPALRLAVESLAEVGTEVSGTISAQAEFSGFLLNPTG